MKDQLRYRSLNTAPTGNKNYSRFIIHPTVEGKKPNFPIFTELRSLAGKRGMTLSHREASANNSLIVALPKHFSLPRVQAFLRDVMDNTTIEMEMAA